MHIYRSIIVLILLIFSLNAGGQDKYTKQLSEHIKKYGQAEVVFEYPGFSSLTSIGMHHSISAVRGSMVHCVLTGKDMDRFLSYGLKFKILQVAENKTVTSALSVEEAMNWDVYPTYQQYDSIIHKLASEHPFTCRFDTIGVSVEGRLILALKISDNVNDDEDEPEVFYTANMHGDELQGFVLMLRLAEHLLINAGNGGLEQTLVDSLEIWINPLSNPDGTYHNGDTISYPTRANSNGTDLNRNFPDPLNPSIVPDVENVAMINFMKERQFVISANFHSGYEVLNFPWDRWLSRIHPDSLWFYNICRRYADTVHYYSTPSYMNSYNDGVVRGAIWYIVYGSRQDYITYELQGREITAELDITKQTPGVQLPLLWEYNYRSFMRYLENAIFGIHGRVIDDVTGEPVRARVFIQAHDRDSSHVYSDPETGSFVRMLSPGTWDLTFIADGYQTETINNIELSEREQKYITVKLNGATDTGKILYEHKLRLWPVPAGDILYIDNSRLAGGKVEIRVFDISGSIVHENSGIINMEDRTMINTSGLPPGYYLLSIIDSTGKVYYGKFTRY